MRVPDKGFIRGWVVEFDAPGREFEDREIGMVVALVDWGGIKAYRRGRVFAKLPDALFLSEIIDPCCFAIDVDGLCKIGNVGE